MVSGRAANMTADGCFGCRWREAQLEGCVCSVVLIQEACALKRSCKPLSGSVLLRPPLRQSRRRRPDKVPFIATTRRQDQGSARKVLFDLAYAG